MLLDKPDPLPLRRRPANRKCIPTSGHLHTFSSNSILIWLEAKTKHILVSHKLIFGTFWGSKCILCPRFLSLRDTSLFSWHLLGHQLARLHSISLIKQTPFKAVRSSWLEDEGGSLPGLLEELSTFLCGKFANINHYNNDWMHSQGNMARGWHQHVWNRQLMLCNRKKRAV